jgi:hypothetical protein
VAEHSRKEIQRFVAALLFNPHSAIRNQFMVDPLRDIKIATPCPADWNAMTGDGRVRFCGQCQLNVYNLSGMSRADAERLVSNHEGRLCVRFYRRHDGTILTQDCPVGLRALRRRAARWATAAFTAAISFFSGVGLTTGWRQYEERRAEEELHMRRMMGAIAPLPVYEPPTPTMGNMVEVKGEMAIEEPTVGRMVALPQHKKR